ATAAAGVQRTTDVAPPPSPPAAPTRSSGATYADHRGGLATRGWTTHQEALMPTFKPSQALLALALSIALIVGSCQDQPSVTEAPHAPHAAVMAAPLQTTAISPTGDTYLNINATNNATSDARRVETWRDARSANAIVRNIDLA